MLVQQVSFLFRLYNFLVLHDDFLILHDWRDTSLKEGVQNETEPIPIPPE